MEADRKRLEVLEKKPQLEEAAAITQEAGFKIFVGGIDFNDLLKKEEISTDEEILQAKNTRIQLFKEGILLRFGPIRDFQEHWDKGYCFASYESNSDAIVAVKTLKIYQERLNICEQLSQGKSDKEKLCIPKPSFYVRWPTFYTNILEKKIKQKQLKKKKSQISTKKPVPTSKKPVPTSKNPVPTSNKLTNTIKMK